MEIYEYIYQREHLQPFVLAKISIALAIRAGFIFDGELADSMGLDLNRQTIKAYMDFGAILLEQEYKYTNDIYIHLMELEKGI